MGANLLAFLSQVPDPRRAASKRHPLPALLAMVVMGHLSGYYGYRELARFMQRHAWELVRLFGFQHGVPSYVTIRQVLGQVSFSAFQQQFQAWAQGENQAGECFSIDGKSLKSTLQQYPSPYQDFVAMVQVFSHQSGLVHTLQAYHNGEQSEGQVVRQLIETLHLKGAMLTLDALHCPKKRSL
jgi:hypothetical protein